MGQLEREVRNKQVKNLLDEVAEIVKDNYFSETGMENMTERRRELEGVGIALSKWTGWAYEDLRVIAYAALEDSNDHSMAAPLYEASKDVARKEEDGND